MTNTTTETIEVTVTSNDDRTEFRVNDHPLEFYPRYRFGKILRRAIDAHLASLPPLDPEWGTRETAGEYVAVFVPLHEDDEYPWRVKSRSGRTHWMSRERWNLIKKEAQK